MVGMERDEPSRHFMIAPLRDIPIRIVLSLKKPVLLILAAAPLLATVVDYAAEGKLWWAHIQFLADDKLQGRNVGTAEFLQAVDYVSGQFRKLGLKPAGATGYRQPVKFDSRLLVQEQSSLTLIRDGKEEPLALGADASLSARAELAPKLEAPMVFVGYGLVIPEAHWDELAGLDLKGKIAVYVNGPSPAEAPAPVKSHLTSAAERWRVLHDAGAVGIATIMAGGRGGADSANAAAAGRGAGRRWWTRRAATHRQSGRSGPFGNHRNGSLGQHHRPRRGQILRRIGPYVRRNPGTGAR
jgi:hypothetical protein